MGDGSRSSLKVTCKPASMRDWAKVMQPSAPNPRDRSVMQCFGIVESRHKLRGRTPPEMPEPFACGGVQPREPRQVRAASTHALGERGSGHEALLRRKP